MKHLLLGSLLAISAFAQGTLSLSNSGTPPVAGYAPGQTVVLNVTKTGNAATTGFQFDVATSAGTLAFAAGPALPSSKTLTCSPAPPTTCLGFGLNTATVPDGVVATVSVTLPTAISSSPVTVTISNPIESDLNGNSIPVTIANPTVSLSIKNGCDVNGDGSVGSADLSAVVNVAILKSTTTATDLNSDGKTNILDVQIVGTAATGPGFVCNAH